MSITVKTPYGTVYGIESLAKAQEILDRAEQERDHEDCAECRGTLTLAECKAVAND